MELKLSPETIGDWLRYIKNSDKPFNWLIPYEANLLSLLQTGLNRERDFRKSYDLLTIVFPYFALNLSHSEQWSPLLADALLMAQDIQNNEFQVKVFRWMGESYLKIGQHQSARSAFSTALERAETGQIDDMKVAVFTGLFKLQWFDLRQNVSQMLVEQALATARCVEDLKLRADLYEALAFAYGRMRETKVALGYGQTALVYWQSLNDSSGLGRAAYTLAAVYTQITQITEDKRFLKYAIQYLEMAHDALSQTNDVWQYPLLAYERAVIYYQLEEYETAASWFQQSLQEADRINAPHYVVIAHHGLGLAQAKLSQFNSARHYLLKALESWITLKNNYEQASVLVGLADLELCAGNRTESTAYIHDGLIITDQIEDNEMQQFLRDQFQDLLEK